MPPTTKILAAFSAASRVVWTAAAEDFATALLRRASALADSNEGESARAILQDLTRRTEDAAIKGEALVRCADIDVAAHRFDRARTILAAANAAIGVLTPSEQRRRVEDACSAVALRLRWFAEGPAALEQDRPFDALIRADARSGVAAALVRAGAALRSGDAARADRLLHYVETSIAHLEGADPEAIVDALTLRAELADFTANDPQLSEKLFARAEDLARRHGLGGRELYASHQLSLTRWMHYRDPHDRAAYRKMVDRINRSLPPRLRSYLTFSAADVELAIGDPMRALGAADAAVSVATNDYESLSAAALAAGAMLRLARTAEAGARAAAVAERARGAGQFRILSLAQRIAAQALFARGDRVSARASIEEAIECAKRFSSPHVLAQSHVVLARITGKFARGSAAFR